MLGFATKLEPMVVPIETFPMGGELIETGCLDFRDGFLSTTSDPTTLFQTMLGVLIFGLTQHEVL